jgi:hypothetical protein
MPRKRPFAGELRRNNERLEMRVIATDDLDGGVRQSGRYEFFDFCRVHIGI